MRMEIINEMNVSKKVSVRNWEISCFTELPSVLRIPISLARCEDCAVVRFIKLIQARINRKVATISKP